MGVTERAEASVLGRTTTFPYPEAALEEEEKDNRVVNYVSPDGDSPVLAAGDSSTAFIADHSFRCVSEAELIYQCLDSCFLLGGGERPGKPELSIEHEGFFHGEHREEKIVLHNVGIYHFQKLRFLLVPEP